MNDTAEEANKMVLSPGCTPSPSIENPIFHKGWEIYRWTGWKGNTAIAEEGDYSISKYKTKCAECGKPLAPGDLYIESQGTDNVFHFECSDSPTKGQLFGQWVAYKRGVQEDRSDWKYCYASAPGSHGSYALYGTFSILPTDGQKSLITRSSQEEFEAAREDAFVRIRKFIDDVESGEVPWPAIWGPKPE